MVFISSDTNVWIDFYQINRLNLPFKLPFIFVMYKETAKEELLYPYNLKDNLLKEGLRITEIDDEEIELAENYVEKYKRISYHDAIALAIAKHRQISLLTGDNSLRKAAMQESVIVFGTLKILDMLFEEEKISNEDYSQCLKNLKNKNGKGVRLPLKEIEKRLSKSSKF